MNPVNNKVNYFVLADKTIETTHRHHKLLSGVFSKVTEPELPQFVNDVKRFFLAVGNQRVNSEGRNNERTLRDKVEAEAQ